MTLAATGELSVGTNAGGVTHQLNSELNRATTATTSLGETAVRNVAGAATGQVTFGGMLGGTGTFNFTVSSNQTNASLSALATAAGWDGVDYVVATIGSGVYVYSTSTGTPALTISGFPNGVKLINNGYIQGHGGKGSNELASDGTAGGDALSLGCSVTIDNTLAAAYIGGGGGGGGGGRNISGSKTLTTSGGGGAGGGDAGAILTVSSNPAPGAMAGGTGSNGYYNNLSAECKASGGGGGGVMPGSGGSGGTASAGASGGTGGGGGGAGTTSPPNAQGGSGGSGSSSGGNGATYPSTAYYTMCAGGGGGWGAAGGSSYKTSVGTVTLIASGLAGGKAVALNGYSVTWVSGDTTRVYGAVS